MSVGRGGIKGPWSQQKERTVLSVARDRFETCLMEGCLRYSRRHKQITAGTTCEPRRVATVDARYEISQSYELDRLERREPMGSRGKDWTVFGYLVPHQVGSSQPLYSGLSAEHELDEIGRKEIKRMKLLADGSETGRGWNGIRGSSGRCCHCRRWAPQSPG